MDHRGGTAHSHRVREHGGGTVENAVQNAVEARRARWRLRQLIPPASGATVEAIPIRGAIGTGGAMRTVGAMRAGRAMMIGGAMPTAGAMRADQSNDDRFGECQWRP